MDFVIAIATMTGTAASAWFSLQWVSDRYAYDAAQRRLEPGEDDLPLHTAHLSSDLAALAHQTRTLRLTLATPVRRFMSGGNPLPWRRRERCDEYDLALCDARWGLWDWLRAVDRLNEEDRKLVEQLGLRRDRLRQLLFMPGIFERTSDVFEELRYPVSPDLERVCSTLATAIRELRRFETALVGRPSSPYR